MKIYLLRHGKTEANIRRSYCGVTDVPICGSGVAELLQKREAGGYPDPAGLDIYVTEMQRTRQTLKILFGEYPYIVEPRFNEMNFGSFEDLTYEQLKDDPDYQAWLNSDPYVFVCPGGESGNMMKARVLAGFADVIAKGRDALLVGHGGTIAYLFMHYFPDSGFNWFEAQPANAEGYLFEVREGIPVSWSRIPVKHV